MNPETVQSVNEEQPKQRESKRIRDAGVDAAWWIQCAPSALGERGISAALLHQLEVGPPDGPSGVPNTDLYSDQQVGFGPMLRGMGTIARSRHCRAVWVRLASYTQAILAARYESRNDWPPGMRARFGGLVGVVVLEQAGKHALSRWEAGHETMVAANVRLRELESAVASERDVGLSGGRSAVIASSARLLTVELKAPPLWWTIVGRGGAGEAIAAAASRLQSARERCPGAPPSERELLDHLRQMAAVEAQGQRLITADDLCHVVSTVADSHLSTTAGRLAEARCEAWARAARRRVIQALECWCDTEDAVEASAHG